MTQAFNSVLEMSESEKVYMRDAAYMVAIKRVVTAMELRAGFKQPIRQQRGIFQP